MLYDCKVHSVNQYLMAGSGYIMQHLGPSGKDQPHWYYQRDDILASTAWLDEESGILIPEFSGNVIDLSDDVQKCIANDRIDNGWTNIARRIYDLGHKKVLNHWQIDIILNG